MLLSFTPQLEVKNEICVNRYWLQIYSNWVKESFFPTPTKRKVSPSSPFNHAWHGTRTANDKKKIDPDIGIYVLGRENFMIKWFKSESNLKLNLYDADEESIWI